MSAAALRDLIEPAVEVDDRMTVRELPALLSGDEPAFMRIGPEWCAVVPRLLIGQPHSRRLLDVPRIPVKPLHKSVSLVDLESHVHSATAVHHSPVLDGDVLIGRIGHDRARASLGPASRRIESLRRTTMALVHDIANALMVIQPALVEGEVGEPAALKAFEHCIMTLGQLRDIHAGVAREDVSADLAQTVPSLIPVLEAIAAPMARIDVGPIPSVRVHCTPLALERALINFVTNAAEAMRGASGSIAIRFEQAPTQVAISVQDDGSGIPASALPHVFERGFSTKRASGRGLGLSNAREDARAVGGDVVAERRAEGGTTIIMSLRRA